MNDKKKRLFAIFMIEIMTIILLAVSGCAARSEQKEAARLVTEQEAAQAEQIRLQQEREAEAESRRVAEQKEREGQIQGIKDSLSNLPIQSIQIGPTGRRSFNQDEIAFLPYGSSDTYIPVHAMGLAVWYDAYGDIVDAYLTTFYAVWEYGESAASKGEVRILVPNTSAVSVRVYFLSMVDASSTIWGDKNIFDSVNSGLIDMNTLIEIAPYFTYEFEYDN